MEVQAPQPTINIAPVINFDLAPIPNVRRERAHQLIDLAIEALPAIDNDVLADMIEALAIALEDAEDAITTEREIVLAAMALAHHQRVELRRLHERYAAVLEQLRATRGPS